MSDRRGRPGSAADIAHQKPTDVITNKELAIMSENDIRQMQEKIDEGIRIAQEKLVEKVKKEDGQLIVTRDGQIVAITASEI